MCGIFCSISKCENAENKTNELEELIRRRGPNASSTIKWDCGNKAVLSFTGHVLWQQGTSIAVQPFVHNDVVFLFNGDIFDDCDKRYEREGEQLSDTAWMASMLSNCTNDEEICRFLCTVEGPFSLILLRKCSGDLYFCRDALGRNSLLIERDHSHLNILSNSYFSETEPKRAAELPPLGLYKMNIWNGDCKLFPWAANAVGEEFRTDLQIVEGTLNVAISLGDSINPKWLSVENKAKNSFDLYELCRSLHDKPVEYIFENLLNDGQIQKELQYFSKLLEKSVNDRVKKTLERCQNCMSVQEKCTHAKIGILFSGGIDCSILAALANKFIDIEEEIDLINVAFQRVQDNEVNNWDVPDRISARNSLTELKSLCPERKWNFVEVNVTRQELQDTLNVHIKHLIYPLSTVLDESIGCAFWFASRGDGLIGDMRYKSPSRVIIVGSGADELFGGYIRHRNAYKRFDGTEQEKLANVHSELEKDWRRIPSRNLARDDRIIGDNGKTARSPFIEEHVVKFVRGLSAQQRCCFLLEEGLGDKLFLRLYGYRIGLRSAASLKKRAIQFGSRIANKKQNAANQSESLNFAIKL